MSYTTDLVIDKMNEEKEKQYDSADEPCPDCEELKDEDGGCGCLDNLSKHWMEGKF